MRFSLRRTLGTPRTGVLTDNTMIVNILLKPIFCINLKKHKFCNTRNYTPGAKCFIPILKSKIIEQTTLDGLLSKIKFYRFIVKKQ